MQNIPKTLREFIQHNGPIQRVVVAYSGGVDSSVLLHALVAAKLGLPIVALHVNHQLSPNALAWQKHCEQNAAALGVPFIIEAVTVENKGQGVEDEARIQRYGAFKKHLQSGDVLLCGHHSGDQLETFFLRLMRGAGVKGLAGISLVRPMALDGRGDDHFARLARPLLEVSKAQIKAYAQHHALSWIEDDSNTSDCFDRNYLRLNVMPALIERWPHAEQKISTATGHLAKANNLLAEYASGDLTVLAPQRERVGSSVLLPVGKGWSDERTNNVLRFWLESCGVKPPTTKQLQELLRVISAKQGQQPVLQLGSMEVRRYKTRLYCLPILPPQSQLKNASAAATFSDQGCATLPDGSVLQCVADDLSYLKTYSIQFRQSGLRGQPKHRKHSQTIKKLLQEYDLEPWLRSQVPFVFSGDTLIAVGDLWVESACPNNLVFKWYYTT